MNIFALIKKTKKQGVKWLLLRCLFEIKNPSTRMGRGFSKPLRLLYRALLGNRLGNIRKDSSKLVVYAVYDLNVDPATYDVAFFLADAEIYANSKMADSIYFIVRKKSADIFSNRDYDAVIDVESQLWRINNVILPIVKMHPLVKNVSLVDDLSEINLRSNCIYPPQYSNLYTPRMDYPAIFLNLSRRKFKGFAVTEQAVRYIRKWVESKTQNNKFITITLRYYGFDEKRNSDVNSWLKFASVAKGSGYHVVFLLDNETCWDRKFDEIRDMVCYEAIWNLELRMALYHEALVNFFKSNGPGGFAHLFREISYISFHPVVNDSPLASEKFYTDRNMPFNKRKYEFSSDRQMLVWKDDTFDNINNAFSDYCKINSLNETV